MAYAPPGTMGISKYVRTEQCLELYNQQIKGDPSVLTCQESANDDDHPILREEVEVEVRH